MQTVAEILDHLVAQAKKHFRRDSLNFEPRMYFVLLYPGQQLPVYFPIPCSLFFESGQAKTFLPTYVKMAWVKKKSESVAGIELIAVCLIADAKFNTQPADGRAIVKPLDDPFSQECLLCLISFKDHSDGKVLPYKRKGSSIEFDDLREVPGEIKGTFKALHPESNY